MMRPVLSIRLVGWLIAPLISATIISATFSAIFTCLYTSLCRHVRPVLFRLDRPYGLLLIIDFFAWSVKFPLSWTKKYGDGVSPVPVQITFPK